MAPFIPAPALFLCKSVGAAGGSKVLRAAPVRPLSSPISDAAPLGAQFNSFVEISTYFSTDFSTKFPVLQAVPHYYKTLLKGLLKSLLIF